MSDIVGAAHHLIGPTGHVADLFAGTTVVGQALADAGFQVTSVDTQQYSRIFASALLGIERAPGEVIDARLLWEASEHSLSSDLVAEWEELAKEEDAAVSANDAAALRAIYQRLPLIWRDSADVGYLLIASESGVTAFGVRPLLTCIYSGSYFGVRQALELDKLRCASERLFCEGRISHWQWSAAITALLSAASAAAHSAGKHFAQPLGIGSSGNRVFLDRRLIEDRRVSVHSHFVNACSRIQDRRAGTFATTIQATAEAFSAADEPGCDLYYLDPPYTAQQYSRFYHLLETIARYEFPKLICDGKITSGLYPAVRFKSSFSSKRRALPAFRQIAEAAKARGTSLLVSYSQSASRSDGNARMITLDQLLNECGSAFGKRNVECIQLSHRYRQFNAATFANTERDDPELLVSCKAR